MDRTESRGEHERPREQGSRPIGTTDPAEIADFEELVTRRESSSGETARANRSWWDANADEYQAEHGEYLGDDRFLWCPEGLYEDEAGLLGPVAGRDVLEVGCGAAQCARWLAGQGARVTAFDLSARQLQHARRIDEAAGRAPLRLVQADATALPFADGVFDIACSAFGAVPFVADSAQLMREAARVLRPGGRFAAFWNAGDPPPAVADVTNAVHRRMMPAAAGYPSPAPASSGRNAEGSRGGRGDRSLEDAYSAIWVKAKEGLRSAGGFGEAEEWRFDWEHSYTKDEWLDQVPTSGLLTRLPPAQLDEVLAEIGAAVDAVGGGFTMRYSTVVITATRQRKA